LRLPRAINPKNFRLRPLPVLPLKCRKFQTSPSACATNCHQSSLIFQT